MYPPGILGRQHSAFTRRQVFSKVNIRLEGIRPCEEKILKNNELRSSIYKHFRNLNILVVFLLEVLGVSSQLESRLLDHLFWAYA